MGRFQRQILLPQIGRSGQKIIADSNVLIVGAGGLCHPASQYLVAMGVGGLGIVDGDIVQISNLHRQVLFSSEDVDKNKAEVLKRQLDKMEAGTKIEAYPFYLNKQKAVELFGSFDVIVDGTDNFASKFLINDMCSYYDKPMVYGAISQFEGQVSVFYKGQGPCYRCLFAHVPKTKIQNCAQSGVIGALPGVIGAMQAMEVLKVLIQLKNSKSELKPLIGRVQYFDFLNNEVRSLKLNKRRECRCQSRSITLDDIEEIHVSTCSLQKPFHSQIDKGHLVDVREAIEWAEYHIEGSTHWPLSRLEQGDVPIEMKDQTITLICRSGVRAERASSILRQKGFGKVNFTEKSIYEY